LSSSVANAGENDEKDDASDDGTYCYSGSGGDMIIVRVVSIALIVNGVLIVGVIFWAIAIEIAAIVGAIVIVTLTHCLQIEYYGYPFFLSKV